ncbi:MAG: DUF4159 domain-containing protein [Gemmatimonadota bacterium]
MTLALLALLALGVAPAFAAPVGSAPEGVVHAMPGGLQAGAGAPAAPVADTTITIGRLQYGGGGDWYANPSALPNLLASIRERTGLPVAQREVTVTPLDPRLRDYPFLYMTGHGNVSFTAREREALRDYLLSGGFLHADDNYGMDEHFRREMAALFPDREMVELPADHPVFHTHYSFPKGLPKIHEHDGLPPEAWGIFHDGRLVVFYTYETDLGNGWEDEAVHGNPPEVREEALRMGVNLYLFAISQLSPR